MIPNRSPWLHQLDRSREARPLPGDHATNVAVVGGGIAGVMTAYWVLRDTDHRVTLVEADRVAHGATGHNAGQITSYFERPFSDIAREYGLAMAAEGQRAVEGAWDLLEEVAREAGLTTPIHSFTGYAGCATAEQLFGHLENNRLRAESGLPTETIHIDRDWAATAAIPDRYTACFSLVSGDEIRAQLETESRAYIALLAYRKGCTNSARLVEELACHLLQAYPERFSLYEHSPVSEVRLKADQAALTTQAGTISADRVVLATNGFETLTICNEAGEDIDTAFHHMVLGRIGYMTGYLEPGNAPPTAISYFPKLALASADPTGEPYYYLTRRPHAATDGDMSLVCAGGPDAVLPNQAIYERDAPGREDMQRMLEEFLQDTYQPYPKTGAEYAFSWHGLMGFTPNGIRRIGIEPRNPILLYNLGCNGVGILPSIHGGKRIARILAGDSLSPSIFDPI